MPTPGSPTLCQGDSAVHPNTALSVNHASRRWCCGLADHTDRVDKDESRPLQHWLRRSCGFAPKYQPALTRCTDQHRSILTDSGLQRTLLASSHSQLRHWLEGAFIVQPLPSESEVTPSLVHAVFQGKCPPAWSLFTALPKTAWICS